MKTLDTKIARILADPGCNDFILADAKDADMAFGVASGGKSPEYHGQEGRFRSLEEYCQLMRDITRSGLVDIMLMSPSNCERLAIRERLFEQSPVTPAARANDTSDIHLAMGSIYASKPSVPFRSATIDHIMCGRVDCEPGEMIGADLGLYSMTFNNDLKKDLRSQQAYIDFRIEAERKGFRHFLEVFDPNAPTAPIPDLPRYVNDMIARTLAGAVGKGRPLFLKIAYHGPAAMEQLASWDRSVIIGILGGAAGTTFDAFHQLWEAKKYGARVALYGRMINQSEHQLTFVQHLRWLADGQITDPAEAVRSYHGALAKLNITPTRPLEEDIQATLRASAYSGGSTKVAVDGGKQPATAGAASTQSADAAPDFSRMTQQEKIAWNLNRWKRVLD